MLSHYYKKAQVKVFIFLAPVLSVFTPSVSSAQSGVIQNPLKITDFPALVDTVLGYILEIGGVVAIFAFIYSGFKFVAARGNETEITKAREIFFNTCIGVAILLGAKIIATIIVGTIKNVQA